MIYAPAQLHNFSITLLYHLGEKSLRSTTDLLDSLVCSLHVVGGQAIADESVDITIWHHLTIDSFLEAFLQVIFKSLELLQVETVLIEFSTIHTVVRAAHKRR